MLWYALWTREFKKRYGTCVEITNPRWGEHPRYWTLSGIKLRDVNSLADVTLIFADGLYGWVCAGFIFDGVICERKILNGKDLMQEIISYARGRTGIDALLKADTIESNLQDFLHRMLDMGAVLTTFNPSMNKPGTCHPVNIGFESNALTSRMIAEDLARKGMRAVNFKIASEQFDCLEGFYAYAKSYFTKNFYKSLVPVDLVSRYRFKISIQLLADGVILTLTILSH